MKTQNILLVSYVCLVAFISSTTQAKAQLKPSTAQQIEALLAEKKGRSGGEKKLSSQLLQLHRESQGKEMAKGVQLHKINLPAEKDGSVLVDIDAAVSSKLLKEIQLLGGKILFSSTKAHSIRATILPAQLVRLAALDSVHFVKAAFKPHHVPVTPPLEKAKGTAALRLDAIKPSRRLAFAKLVEKLKLKLKTYDIIGQTGSVISEGDHAMGADSAKLKYGYQGEGIRIGVLSDSYNNQGAADFDAQVGELPGTGNPFGDTTAITIVEEDSTGSGHDEGRAMLQIIHDLAPKAQLFFATGNNGEADYAANIEALGSAPYNCDIIIDDLAYLDEPAFQDGIVAQAVNTVTANGSLYFSSAGNGGSFKYNFSSVWEGDFNPLVSAQYPNGSVHNFGTAAAVIPGDSVITPSSIYTLQWSDAAGKSDNDYDLFLIDTSGNVVASSTNSQTGSEDPLEYIEDSTALIQQNYQFIVFQNAGAQNRAIRLNANLDGQGEGFTQTTASGTSGHNSAVNAFGVAAMDASLVYPGVFTTKSKVEYFSSDGPRRVFYNADGTAITPGNFLNATNGGTLRKKPDITAADGVNTSVSGFAPFYGTSAAAPHAGAVAALLKSAKPTLTTTQIRSLLTSTAIDVEAKGYDYNSGSGVVNALKAMQSLAPTPKANLILTKSTVTEGSFSNHNGIIDPGESVNISLSFTNPSLATASGLVVSLLPDSSGEIIYSPAVALGDVKSYAAAVTVSPLVAALPASSVACGSTAVFFARASYGGGTVPYQTFAITVPTGGRAETIIKGTVGKTPKNGSNYTAKTGIQTDRLSRNGIGSTCSDLADSGLIGDFGKRHYDAYTFTNTGAVDSCMTVTVSSIYGDSLYAAAYIGKGGFVKANPDSNLIGHPYYSDTLMEYGFTSKAKTAFTVVVHDLNAGGAASNNPYIINVSHPACAAAPACTPVVPNAGLLPKAVINNSYLYVYTATGGSGLYSSAIIGSLPKGLSFSGDSLVGTPAQLGSFPIKIIISDLMGCTAGTRSDTLVVGDNLPLQLAYFGVSKSPSTSVAVVAWQTLTETNTDNFSIERSTNGQPFYAVGSIAAAGSSTQTKSYSFGDALSPALSGATLYYRLKIIDKDGSFSYSKTVKLAGQNIGLSLVPNPARQSTTLVFATPVSSGSITVINAEGKKVKEVKISGASLASYTLSTTGLAPGVYTVRFANEKTVANQQLLIQK
ncbi:S8 family serine peptidase [Parasediminibacterium sp. JCM 36343]|uniref:S8 family serine peptidase n=1 Tax=Parasediminibacterium sp. JCM 36343 TaxID=3374279 RepID=UPI00397E382B